MSFQQVSGQSEVRTHFSSGGQWFQPSGSRTVTGMTQHKGSLASPGQAEGARGEALRPCHRSGPGAGGSGSAQSLCFFKCKIKNILDRRALERKMKECTQPSAAMERLPS